MRRLVQDIGVLRKKRCLSFLRGFDGSQQFNSCSVLLRQWMRSIARIQVGQKRSLREGEIDKQKRVNQFIIRMGRNHLDESTEYRILQVKRPGKDGAEKKPLRSFRSNQTAKDEHGNVDRNL